MVFGLRDDPWRTDRQDGSISLVFFVLFLATATSLLPSSQVGRFHFSDQMFTPLASPVQNSVLREVSSLHTQQENHKPDLSIALDHFVFQMVKFNKANQREGRQREIPPIQIVPRGSNALPPHQPIQTTVFFQPKSAQAIVAISSSSSCSSKECCQVDLCKIRSLLPGEDDEIVALTPDEVACLCGFPPETLPPIGQYLAAHVSLPFIVLDQSLLKTCQTDNLMFLGGAGYPYWNTLVDPESMLQLSNLLVADILFGETKHEKHDDDGNSGEDGRSGKDADPPSSSGSFVYQVPTGPISTQAVANGSYTPETSVPTDPFRSGKPYFPFNVPPVHLARILAQQREISNPLPPSIVSMVGRVGRIKLKTKRFLSFEFCPPFPLSHCDRYEEDSDHTFPWLSPQNGRNMKVELSIGKATKQRESLIETIEEGQIIHIDAKTITGQRESLAKWVELQCLDLELIDCRMLVPSEGPLGNMGFSDRDAEHANMVRRSSTSSTVSQLPYLTLVEAFNCEAGKPVDIILVDSLERIESFSCDFASLLVLSREDDEKFISLTRSSVGIDCEWQPAELIESKNEKKMAQPVLLLQISLNALEKVYLFDLQTLLRPLRQPDQPMNDLEKALSDCLGPLWKSKFILKVGYQLPSDLRRIAASYPHLPCFREVHSVLEISSLIKRVLHVSKQKRSRYITMSLAAMTSHYLGRSIDKGHQMSNWAARPLSAQQLEYASLDAAVSPILADRALKSIYARICNITAEDVGQNGIEFDDYPGPFIERWQGDMSLSKEIMSWRFHVLGEAEEVTVSKLDAKQVVGSSWIATKSWIYGQTAPPPSALAGP